MEICNCGLLKQSKAGTHADADGAERCNNCGKPTSFSVSAIVASTSTVLPSMMTTLASLPDHRFVRMHGIVTELAATSGLTATSKGTAALDNAMANLRRTAAAMGANAVVGLQGSVFGAAGGITSAFGGDAVGVLLMGTAVTVEAVSVSTPSS